MKKILLLTCLTTLTACMSPLSKPGITSAEYQKDTQECSYEANKATGGNDDQVVGMLNNLSIYKDCLRARGYTTAAERG